MDFTNILVTAVLAMGVFSADALLNADNINIQISMPRGYGASEISVGNDIAENLFLNEVADIIAVPTFAYKPEVRSNEEATVVSLLADMLGLKDLTYVIQRAVGLDPIILNGSVTKSGDQHRFVVVSNVDARKRIGAVEVVVSQAPGEPITSLIRRGAVATMLAYEDYLALLYLMTRASSNTLAVYEPSLAAPGFAGVDALIQKHLDQLPTGVLGILKGQEIAHERAMLINLRGMVALEETDAATAATLFEQAMAQDPGFVVPFLNLAFTRVHQDRYQEGIDLARQVIDRRMTDDPILLAAAHITWAVAAWGMRQHEVAMNQFRRALHVYPRSTMANVYWGEMLQGLGDADGARARFAMAKANLEHFESYAELAMLRLRLTNEDNRPLTKINIY